MARASELDGNTSQTEAGHAQARFTVLSKQKALIEQHQKKLIALKAAHLAARAKAKK